MTWFFDVKEEADAAHAVALESKATVVAFYEDYVSDCSELQRWLLGESLE